MHVRFSIIVPTRDRGASLERCLMAIQAQDFPRDGFEVLVVDDGSEPPVQAVVAGHAGELAVRYLRTEGVGPASARNLGLRQALGEYAVFTDDDCRPAAQWLTAFEAAIAARPCAGLGGRIVDSPLNGICGQASQMLVSFLYDYNERANGLRFFCSNNLAFPRRELLEMGGFDESFPLAAAEDRFVCARWLKRGELGYVAGAVVEHRQMLDLRGFLRQQFRYGRGAFQFWQRRQSEGDVGVRLEPWSFYSRMLLYPFGRASVGRALVTMVLLAASQVACAAGYFSERFEAQRTAEIARREVGVRGSRS